MAVGGRTVLPKHVSNCTESPSCESQICIYMYIFIYIRDQDFLDIFHSQIRPDNKISEEELNLSFSYVELEQLVQLLK